MGEVECGLVVPPWGRAAALLARDEGLQAILQTSPLGLVIIHRPTHIILRANQKALPPVDWLREPGHHGASFSGSTNGLAVVAIRAAAGAGDTRLRGRE